MKQLLTLLTLSFFICTSCDRSKQEQPQEKQTIRMNIGAEPTTLDPRKIRDLSSTSFSKMLFEGLTRMNAQGEAEPALAKAIEVSEDGKQYTFHLRESTWSDGKRLTAEDFVSAWKDVLDPSFPSSMAFQLYVIKNGKEIKSGELSPDQLGARALSKDVLQVELENPIPYFLKLITFPTFFPIPVDVVRLNPAWTQEAETLVNNGPFKIKKWNHNDSIELCKNPHYWDSENVILKKIDLCMVGDSTECLMFEKGELDWAGSPLSILPLDTLETLNKEQSLYRAPYLATNFYRLNVDKPPVNNLKIRKALSLAIDRQTIIDNVTNQTQAYTTCFVPSSMGLKNEGYHEEYNLEKARELFKEALQEVNLSLEEFPKLTLLYIGGERAHLIAQAIQRQWFDAFQIHLQLEAVEKKVYFSRISHQDYQIADGSWYADYDDPISFLEIFKYKSASTNNTQWENSEYARLLDRAQICTDTRERMHLLSESEKKLLDEAPLIPIYNHNMLYLKREDVKGVVLSSLGTIDLKWAYVE